MDGLMPGESFKGLGNGEQFPDGVVFHGLSEPGFLVDGFFKRDFQLVGNQLGYPVNRGQWYFQNPAHITQNSPRLHGTVGNYLGDVFGAAVTFANIFYYLVTSFLAEIDIKVGHGLTFNIEETLKYKAVGYRVNIGYEHAESSQTAGSGTASRSDRNFFFFCPGDKISDNKKVSGKAHGANDLYFHGQPVLVLLFQLRTHLLQFAQMVKAGG